VENWKFDIKGQILRLGSKFCSLWKTAAFNYQSSYCLLILSI